jgi:micrococcal nuclease
MRFKMTCLAALLADGVIAFCSNPSIPSTDAKRHVGETVTVCGRVAGTSYIVHVRPTNKVLGTYYDTLTFLNFDRPYPDHTFAVIIPGSYRDKFGKPEVKFKSKDVCVSGTIYDFEGKPQMVVTDPDRIVETDPKRAGLN